MKGRILYVEDEPFLARIVKETLESQQYTVRHVGDGGKVMEALREFQPDVCVLDVMLPNTDGFSLGAQIRKLFPVVPVIFLTAKTHTSDVVKGFSSGGTDYLKKPFSMEELMARIDNQLRITRKLQATDTEQQEIKLGFMRFYPLLYELHTPGRVAKLSHRETQVLQMLCDSGGPIERSRVLKEVWGDDSFFNSRNLDVYIRKLREHLSEDPNVEIITLKGIGFHLVVRQG